MRVDTKILTQLKLTFDGIMVLDDIFIELVYTASVLRPTVASELRSQNQIQTTSYLYER